jgi:hypothetical protein
MLELVDRTLENCDVELFQVLLWCRYWSVHAAICFRIGVQQLTLSRTSELSHVSQQSSESEQSRQKLV